MDLSQIMSRKLVWVEPDDRVMRVRELFNEYRFHHLLVIDDRKLVGVISDRDLLKNLSPFIGKEMAERSQDAALLERRVHQIMTRKLVTASPETAVANAVQTLVTSRVSCLPVVDDRGCAVGIVTWKDLFAAMLPGLQLPPVRPEELDALEESKQMDDALTQLGKDLEDTLAFVKEAMSPSLRDDAAHGRRGGKTGG